MKHCILIIDGAAGHPLLSHNNQTSLELAQTPHLDALAKTAMVGKALTVPPGMEPSSAIACMSIVGYDPQVYYKGRSAIEAQSMGIKVGWKESVFRCNLVNVQDDKMLDYSAGHITTEEARELILTLEKELGDAQTQFFPGVAYRHLLKLKGHPEAVDAICTPPHDISSQPIAGYLPKGPGSDVLNDLMLRSEAVLRNHPVNLARRSRGENSATTIWLFWPSGQVPNLPSFKEFYGQKAAMISAVDLLRGIALMAGIEVVNVPGVTDGPDNDYKAQALGALKALETNDLVVVHVEAPDEAGHAGSIELKIEAIEKTDREIVSRLREVKDLRLLVMPDHPTPIELKTHTGDPVPFLLWGPGFSYNGAKRLTEVEAASTGILVQPGHDLVRKLIST